MAVKFAKFYMHPSGRPVWYDRNAILAVEHALGPHGPVNDIAAVLVPGATVGGSKWITVQGAAEEIQLYVELGRWPTMEDHEAAAREVE